MITEETIDQAVTRLLKTRFKLGMFDPPEDVPYANIPYEVNDSPEHRRLALQAARESIVLLKNEGGMLPLNREEIKSIAVIGPNADSKEILLGNYFGVPSQYVTPLSGIREVAGPGVRILYAEGCDLTTTTPGFWGEKPTSGLQRPSPQWNGGCGHYVSGISRNWRAKKERWLTPTAGETGQSGTPGDAGRTPQGRSDGG